MKGKKKMWATDNKLYIKVDLLVRAEGNKTHSLSPFLYFCTKLYHFFEIKFLWVFPMMLFTFS